MSTAMIFLPVTPTDLEDIASLRPEGWPDITPWFRFYLANGFCSPFKLVLDGRIAGSGVLISFGESAWFAHIIVRPEHRRLGLGSAIVHQLLERASERKIRTVSLIATDLGFPVYEKAGFRVVGEYRSFSTPEPIPSEDDPHILPFEERFRSDCLRLDKKGAGEDRSCVIDQFLPDSFVYAEGNSLRGFYLPQLGEGLVIADDPEAGTVLMRKRFSSKTVVHFPASNAAAIRCAEESGLKQFGLVRRMVFGDDLPWRPEMIFGRIGGNMG